MAKEHSDGRYAKWIGMVRTPARTTAQFRIFKNLDDRVAFDADPQWVKYQDIGVDITEQAAIELAKMPDNSKSREDWAVTSCYEALDADPGWADWEDA